MSFHFVSVLFEIINKNTWIWLTLPCYLCLESPSARIKDRLLEIRLIEQTDCMHPLQLIVLKAVERAELAYGDRIYLVVIVISVV